MCHSKHLFTFLLTELGTVRLTCLKCKKVAEMALDALALQPPGSCPFCMTPWNPTHQGMAPLQAFFAAAVELQKLAKVVEVEFVLPQAPPKP